MDVALSLLNIDRIEVEIDYRKLFSLVNCATYHPSIVLRRFLYTGLLSIKVVLALYKGSLLIYTDFLGNIQY